MNKRYLTLGIVFIVFGLVLTFASMRPMLKSLLVTLDFSGFFFFIAFALGLSMIIAGLFHLQLAGSLESNE